jgi:polyphosphate kinase 2 (PPK2 family)
MRYAAFVAIDLRKFESGDSAPTAEPSAPLLERLVALQLAQIVHRQRAMILFEGWNGSGKRAALRRLAGAWDPCAFATHCPTGDDQQRHWLAPYWASLPGPGATALFHGSWYRQVADDRLAGRLTDKAWARRCDEINEFEAQQRDFGTHLVKLFFHVTAEVQAERLAERDADPWRRWLVTDRRMSPPRDIREGVWTDLLRRTDTRWAPWTVIDANGQGAGSEAALAAVAAALETGISMEPPAEGDKVVMLGQQKAGQLASG